FTLRLLRQCPSSALLRSRGEELLEVRLHRLQPLRPVQPFLRGGKPVPARQLCRKIHLLPLRMPGLPPQLRKLREERVHEGRDPTISLRRPRPIHCYENSVDTDGLNRLALWNQVWIDIGFELRWNIGILKRGGKRNSEQPQAIVARY